MYGGVAETVVIKCENQLLNSVFDRFGTDIFVRPEDGDHFIARIKAANTPVFQSWVVLYGMGIKIISPQSFADALADRAEKVHGLYQNKPANIEEQMGSQPEGRKR